MTLQFFCPYLDSEVELTQEREIHILERHPDLPARYQELIANTLANPEEVRCDVRFENTLLFSLWYCCSSQPLYRRNREPRDFVFLKAIVRENTI